MDGLGSIASESGSMGDSYSAAKFGFESAPALSFWRFFPDMGKKGREGGREEIGETKKKLNTPMMA